MHNKVMNVKNNVQTEKEALLKEVRTRVDLQELKELRREGEQKREAYDKHLKVSGMEEGGMQRGGMEKLRC